MLSGKWRPYCIGLNVFMRQCACQPGCHHDGELSINTAMNISSVLEAWPVSWNTLWESLHKDEISWGPFPIINQYGQLRLHVTISFHQCLLQALIQIQIQIQKAFIW